MSSNIALPKWIPAPRSGRERLAFWPLLAYALPAFQTALVQGPAASIVPTLYATDFGLSLTVIGTVVFLSRIFDAFVDPTVGYLSDHTRSRLGPRKPWLVAGGLLTVVATYFLFIPPRHPSSAYFLTWYVAIYLAWSFSEIPHAAWGFEISRDYRERSRIFSLRILLLTAGSTGILLLPLLPVFPTTAITPQTLRVVAGSVLFIVPLTVTIALVWAPTGVSTERSGEYHLRDLISIIRNNRPLWMFLAAFLPNGFATGMFGALTFLYFSDYLGIAKDFVYIFIVVSVAQLLFMPLVAPIMNRFGKHQTWAVSISLGLAILPLILLLPPGQASVLPLILLVIPIGFSNALTQVAPVSVFGDVIDYDTLRTGKKRAATYSALFTLLLKLNLAAGSAAAFLIVGLMGYHPGAMNSHAAVLGLKIAYIVAPTLINVAAIYFVWTFPLNRRRQAIIKRRLETLEARAAVQA